MRAFAWMGLIAVTTAALAASAPAERNPVRTHPHGDSPMAEQRLIVKLRDSTLSAGGASLPPDSYERIAALLARHGLGLLDHRPITAGMHAVRIEPAAGETAAESLRRLSSDQEVEFAVADERRYIHAAPNDPLYSQQWFLQAATATIPSAVDAQDAWSTTTGSATLVIADIDTGVRPSHPDLSTRLLAGYCFISDPVVSNGGSCPGPGAVDPGDWVTSTDATQHPSECSQQTQATPSSWHGTRVAGILGAATNNSVGVAGVTWSSQILPVRALGKCGGLDSDIITAMLWAGGIAVTVNNATVTNPNPARIINMSLGGSGSCPASYTEAIGQLSALGVLVVASAGNEGGPVDAPANCPGVAGVAGLRQAGTKVGYSSLGPEIALAAPAGNCGDAFAITTPPSPCVYSMTTTTNLAAMAPLTPDANDYTGLYSCDSTTGSSANCSIAAGEYRTSNIGTSFSAPVVSGIAALMSSVNGKLNSCQLISRLKQSAQPFPQTSLDAATQPAMCHVPGGAGDIQNSECICTRDDKTCGAGMANAPAAVAAALRPIAAVVLPGSVSAGQSVTLDASGSAAVNGHSVSGYQWSPVSGGLTFSITGAATPKATITAPSCGVGTVAVTVTDDAGQTDTADVVITPASASSPAPAAAGDSCSTLATPVVVEVCPGTDSVQTGGSATFAATLANTTNSAVTWQVNNAAGGSSTYGTITAAGVYTAPATVPSPATVTINAVSQADGTTAGSAQVTITAPPASGGGGGGGTLDWLTLLAAGVRVMQLGFRRRV